MQILRNKRILTAVALSLGAIFLCLQGDVTVATPVSADAQSDIQAKIDANNQKIAALQKQIDQYSTLLNSTSAQAQTLSATLKNLELTQARLEADLALTTKNISKTTLTLSQINKQIADTEAKIGSVEAAISQSMRDMQMAESQSVVESLLANRSISDVWDYVNAVETLQSQIEIKANDLRDLDTSLNIQKDKAMGEQTKLVAYQRTLTAQQQVVLQTKSEKSQLLSETNGREATYRQILAEKIALKEASEKELYAYESQLQSINPSLIPAAGHGIISWPLASIRITQYFGKTVDSRRLYTSGTHNGVDLAASIGTPVYAALSGTVTDTEPTKTRSGCQYGKFVLIKHPNGLSTIYGHLSYVAVKPGDPVVTGDVIGYSGETGYATGPHLHLGLYVTSGIRVVDAGALGSKYCAGIKTVASPPSGYLDPMAYLPSL